MADYRRGDVQTPYGSFRLTVGALAELSARLGAESPKALAAKLRQLTPETSRLLITALLRPCGSHKKVDDMGDAELANLMPEATHCILDALEPRT